MHVVPLVTPDGAYGGPVTSALDQVRELRRRGHDVTVCGAQQGDPDLVDAVLFPVRRILPHRFAGLVSTALLRWLWRGARSFDVVHIHTGRDLATIMAALVCRLRRVPYVVQTHGMVGPDARLLARAYDLLATRPAIRGACERLVLTNGEAERLRQVVGGSSQIVTNGVEKATVSWNPVAPPLVVFVGRLHAVKQPDVFVAAADEVLRRGLDARFVLFGPGGPMTESVIAAIVATGRGDSIRYVGAVRRTVLASHLAGAAAFVLPSSSEVCPMSLLEALSIGVPSIVTSGCEIAADVKAAGAAVVVEPSVPAVAAAMAELLTNPDMARDLHLSALRVADTAYSIEAVVGELLGIYERTRTSSS